MRLEIDPRLVVGRFTDKVEPRPTYCNPNFTAKLETINMNGMYSTGINPERNGRTVRGYRKKSLIVNNAKSR